MRFLFYTNTSLGDTLYYLVWGLVAILIVGLMIFGLSRQENERGLNKEPEQSTWDDDHWDDDWHHHTHDDDCDHHEYHDDCDHDD